MTPSQNNETGRVLRQAFLQLLAIQGTDCETGGETRRALIEEDKPRGMYIFKFADEFPAKKEDKIRNCATEQMFSVIGMRPVSRGGSFHHFEVGAVGT